MILIPRDLLKLVYFLNFMLLPLVTGQSLVCPNERLTSLGCICTQTKVSCSNRKLSSTPTDALLEYIGDRGDPANIKKLTVLDLSFNLISDLRPNSFVGLGTLKSFYLNNNRIIELQAGAFEDLHNLVVLLFYSNRINFIHPQAFVGLSKLQTLHLNNNELMTLDSSVFSSQTSLRYLFLDNNKLVALDSNLLRQVKQFSFLRLSNNAMMCSCELLWLKELARTVRVEGQCRLTHTLRSVELKHIDLPKEKCQTKSLELTRLPQDRIQVEGDTIAFECQSNRPAQSSTMWLKDGLEISWDNASRFGLLPNGGLEIKRLEVEDEGFYVCAISSGSERKYAQAHLTVNAPVIFLRRPQDAQAVEGEFVDFQCAVSGKPRPTVEWTLNGRPIEQSANGTHLRYELYQDNQRLRVNSLRRSEHAGLYTCSASNGVGPTQSRSARLVVEDALPPAFQIAQQNTSVFEDHAVTLECFAAGSPKPEVSWYQNGHRLVADSRVHFDTFGYLNINQVRVSDAGEYTCRAHNLAGNVVHKFHFSVKDIYGTVISDKFIESVVKAAREEINGQYTKTYKSLYDRRRPKTISDLLALVRFPKNKQLKSLVESEEIYERALDLIYRYADNITFNLTTEEFITPEVLSHQQLQRISDLTACHRHKRRVDCASRCLAYRTIDGTCNNLAKPSSGAANTPLRRLLPALYENGFSTPRGWNRSRLYNGFALPSARRVSARIMSSQRTSDDSRYSHMLMQWGQFLDHDISHTVMALSLSRFSNGIACRDSCSNEQPCFPIEFAPHERPHSVRSDQNCMEFVRSAAVCGSGETSLLMNKLHQREQVNQITAYIDASNVYGSSDQDAFDIRERARSGGKLKTYVTQKHPKGLLPFNLDTNMDCQRDNTSTIGCFLAGDYRANEQLGLLAMHNLFVRRHNRLADRLQQMNGHWGDEQIFQTSRKIVGAQMQIISFEHWLPHVIGKEGMRLLGDYHGYDAHADSAVINEFATAAFRFGHALIQPFTYRLNSSFEPIAEGNLLLRDSFFSPERYFFEGALDPILRGLYATPAKLKQPAEILNTELTERLFYIVRSVSQDLAALNIQRGRDHGLPGYTAYRSHCQLPEIKDFEDLHVAIASQTTRDALRELYGHVDNIDLWVGGILEDSVASDSKLGPLFMCIIVEQMKSLRHADRFWYENEGVFTSDQIAELKKASLASVICENGDDIEHIQADVFLNAKWPEQMLTCADLAAQFEMSMEPWRDTKSAEATHRKQDC